MLCFGAEASSCAHPSLASHVRLTMPSCDCIFDPTGVVQPGALRWAPPWGVSRLCHGHSSTQSPRGHRLIVLLVSGLRVKHGRTQRCLIGFGHIEQRATIRNFINSLFGMFSVFLFVVCAQSKLAARRLGQFPMNAHSSNGGSAAMEE